MTEIACCSEDMACGAAVVVVVDDEPAVANLVAQLFDARGMPALACTNAQTALAHASSPIDVQAMIVDVNLGAWHGPELVAEIRAGRPDLPVVFMSGREVVPEARHTCFLSKPFTPAQLMAAFEKAVRG